MILVLNEWVFHDLLRENGVESFKETARFLISFKDSDDRMVYPPEERWKQKAFRLMTMSEPPRETGQPAVSQSVARFGTDYPDQS